MQSDLQTLEFPAVRRLLEKLASTPYGAEAARNLTPAPDLGVARRMQAAVSAARVLIEGGRAPRLDHVPDVRAALRQASQSGAALAATALAHLASLLQEAVAIARAVHEAPALYPGGAEDLTPPPALAQRLKETLLPTGQLRPDASARLRELTDQLKILRGEIEALLVQRANTLAPGDARERVVWQGHRALLALPPDAAQDVKGVRRGAAVNGRDQLVEPLDAVVLNNRAEALFGQQEAEQQVIRRALTDAVRAEGARLNRLIDAVTWIDLALAGGHFSVHLNATAPRLVEGAALRFERAYHPAMLLQFADRRGPQPVPLSIHLNAEQPMLVITGPNTGGKTVVLKTVGLLVTMAHCGLHLPCEGECEVGEFTRVVVGIGDPQNLHHHLSTFAGHVELLKRLLADADGATLVLLDELGTGTDPEEGAALAMAVLDELSARGARGVITTHLAPLKAYAERAPGLRNASMHFDEERLAPTYELKIGESGRSLGLLIAGKSGLPEALLERARRHLREIAPNRDPSP